MKSLARRVIRQVVGDKRTVALLLIAPMLIMTLLSLLLGNTNYVPSVAIYENELPPVVVSALQEEDIHILDISGQSVDTVQYLTENKDVDAVFSLVSSGAVITVYETSSKSAAAMKAVQNAIAALNPSAQAQIDYVLGDPDEPLFMSMGYIFFGVISFFLIFIVSGMALVRERSNGTLERMLMTPISRRAIVGGYTAGYGLFAAIQAVVLVVFGIYALGLHSEGNAAWVILIMLLLAIAAVSFGEMISIFANTEFQVVQMIPIVIIPQIFFSGLIPIDTIPYHLGYLCYIVPIYYGCTAIKEVMILGNGLEAIWVYLAALLAYIFVFSLINTMALKKYRRL